MILSKSNLSATLGLCALLMFSSAVLAQTETVQIKRPAQLRDAPGETSPSLLALPVQTAVTRLGERQGPWIKVRMADGIIGWVHMFDVTSASGSTQASGGAGASALRNISNFFNKGSAQAQAGGVATSTLGIRGLGAENLANAQPDLAAVAQADAMRLNATQAQQFASAAALAPRQVAPLAAPAAPARSSGPAASGGQAQ